MPTFRLEKPPSRDKWDRALGRGLILTTDGTRKYGRRFGVPLSRILLAGWGTRPHDMSTFWEEIPPHSPDTYVDVLRAATLDAIERPQQSQDPAWECAR